MATQTENGKAFEYACLDALYNALKETGEVEIEDSPQMRTAKTFFENADDEAKSKLLLAAQAAARVIIQLEPQLENPNDNIPLYISIQTNALFQR